MNHAPRTAKRDADKAATLIDPPRELRELLASLLSEHQTLGLLLAEQREAIRRADPEALASVTQRHERTVARIADLEQRRVEIVRCWPVTIQRTPGRQITMSDLASSLPEPARTECLAVAARLRATLEQTRTAANTLRAASSSLLAHMEGLMRHVGRRLSHAGTYGRTGEVEPVASVVSALDLTR